MSVTPVFRPSTDRRSRRGRSASNRQRAPFPELERRAPAVQRPAVRTKAKAEPAGKVAVRRVALVALLGCASFIGSSFVGSVLVEKTRTEGIDFAKRSREARRAEGLLRDRIQELTSLDSVEQWALANGFVAPGAGAPTSD